MVKKGEDLLSLQARFTPDPAYSWTNEEYRFKTKFQQLIAFVIPVHCAATGKK